MTLKEQIAAQQKQADAQERQIVSGSRVVVNRPARSYPNSTFTFDNNVGFDPDSEVLNSQSRPMWKVGNGYRPELVAPRGIPVPVSATGIQVSPVITSGVLAAVPDMTLAVRATANVPVQVSWQVSASLATSTASGAFILYRDGQRIGQFLYGNSPANQAKFSVTQTYIDNPGSGLHAYSVYWSVTGGTMTADANNRLISAMVLRPQ
jgi:hypothetical protein